MNGLFLRRRNNDVEMNVILLHWKKPKKTPKEQMEDHAGSSEDTMPNIFDTKILF